MSKFRTELTASNEGVKEKRVGDLEETIILEVDELLGTKRKDVNKLNIRISKLTDLAPDNTYSLKPGGNDFDAGKWVNELYQAKLDLKLKKIELGVITDLKKEWFEEVEEAND